MERIAARLRELVVAIDEYRRAVAGVTGTGVNEAVALAELLHQGPTSPSVLGKRLGIASASVTALLDRLEMGGLIERTSNPTDRRSVLVVLTPRGRATSEAIFAMFSADISEAVQHAQPEHIEEFAEMLDRIILSLRDRAGDADAIATGMRLRASRREAGRLDS
jgi:DNA-binding MarR family transcriptional regulator